MVLLCLLALFTPSVAVATNVLTDRTSRPGDAPRRWAGFEVGPTFSLPLPTASANREVIGLDAGLSFTAKPTPSSGIGANIAYHYWPVSSRVKQEFNELLRAETWNTLRLGGGAWGLQVAQFGLHARVAAPPTLAVRPWLQLGGSFYIVDPNTTGFSGNAGFFTVTASSLRRTQHQGGSVAIGADLFGGSFARMGLDATYHFVDCSRDYGEDLKILTLGAHASFGR